MGARGPLPAAVVVPIRSGTKVELPKGSPRPRPVAPRMPGGLPAVARVAWENAVTALEPTGILSEADGPVLELAVRAFAVAVAASEVLLAAGAAVDDVKQGRLAKHPASQVMRDHTATFLECAKQLGLSPTARLRMPAGSDDEPGDPDSPFD